MGNQYLERIKGELSSADQALTAGNKGKARVCARRAAGQAITWFLSKHPRENWGTAAMTQLLNLKDDQYFPQAARDAATRLTTKISDQFRYPFTANPIDDARIIVDSIRQLMGQNDD